jgi:hypothetical protein
MSLSVSGQMLSDRPEIDAVMIMNAKYVPNHLISGMASDV